MNAKAKLAQALSKGLDADIQKDTSLPRHWFKAESSGCTHSSELTLSRFV